MNWDDYFLNGCDWVKSKSKDQSTKVGAIIVGPNKEIRSTGYNGFPRDIHDHVKQRHERPHKYDWTEHAERNAIYNAARMGTSLESCTLYCSHNPCNDCVRGIIQSGIKRVVIRRDNTFSSNTIYGVNNTLLEMLAEAEIELIYK